MVIFHSYVNVYQRVYQLNYTRQDLSETRHDLSGGIARLVAKILWLDAENPDLQSEIQGGMRWGGRCRVGFLDTGNDKGNMVHIYGK